MQLFTTDPEHTEIIYIFYKVILVQSNSWCGDLSALFMKIDYFSANSTPATVAAHPHLSTGLLQSGACMPAIKMVLWLNKSEAGYKTEANALLWTHCLESHRHKTDLCVLKDGIGFYFCLMENSSWL